MNLDDSTVKTALEPRGVARESKETGPRLNGSCALLSMYDSNIGTWHVACTGDTRAVWGQQKLDGKWEAMPLSVDQTGKNKEGIARLHKEHPDEEDIIQTGGCYGLGSHEPLAMASGISRQLIYSVNSGRGRLEVHGGEDNRLR
ncbi:protein serine/threonine phosphatase 2C [Penicillium cf. griseofulvum]|uniref:Protein serine/threonine phosphatase 2C n=1 Tax=Penicillium cf. griseofulvum TaxID=2972120 RepID=A0A9W9IUF8_9EURO|nr:protein serine/threonine phosphatase 2C [Penicillium cf. griseofulvum]KAJ5429834.1 protein serine/threonine phosphatase 2C [Penicillium cf. griseofulvum]KAJ5436396.1 protein serine/threonine phosphatase 2C [Penicillium cf. griseofulvum]